MSRSIVDILGAVLIAAVILAGTFVPSTRPAADKPSPALADAQHAAAQAMRREQGAARACADKLGANSAYAWSPDGGVICRDKRGNARARVQL